MEIIILPPAIPQRSSAGNRVESITAAELANNVNLHGDPINFAA